MDLRECRETLRIALQANQLLLQAFARMDSSSAGECGKQMVLLVSSIKYMYKIPADQTSSPMATPLSVPAVSSSARASRPHVPNAPPSMPPSAHPPTTPASPILQRSLPPCISGGCSSSSQQLHALFGGGRSMFGKKKAKKRPRCKEWTHTFVCLSQVDADSVPTLLERTTLKLLGLGEKHFPIPIDADALGLEEVLVREFPPLADGGGYDFLTKEEGTGKNLNLIPCPPEGYSTAFLKGVVGGAKVYIRPLQRPIGTDSATTRSQVSETLRAYNLENWSIHPPPPPPPPPPSPL